MTSPTLLRSKFRTGPRVEAGVESKIDGIRSVLATAPRARSPILLPEPAVPEFVELAASLNSSLVSSTDRINCR